MSDLLIQLASNAPTNQPLANIKRPRFRGEQSLNVCLFS